MFESAWAQGAPGPGGLAGGLSQFAPLILIFVIFYFLLIRPQVKRQRQHQELLKSLKIGDQVLTASGIIGTVKNLTEKIVTLEVADSVRLRMLRGQVSQIITGNLEQITDTP